MNTFERYVAEEHVEDFNDRLISRRELIRRVTLITGSVAATIAFLEVVGCGAEPSGTAPQSTARSSSTPRPFATPPAQATANGVTVAADDPRIKIVSANVKGPDGASLVSYLAGPSSGGRSPSVLVIHENRGLTEHIRDVVRRVATAGYVGLSIDLLSRDGGADQLTDAAAYAAALAKRTNDAMVADIQAALSQLDQLSTAAGGHQGIVGFCFGGGMVWNTLVAGAKLRAAVPFYGPAPQNSAGLATTPAAVFAVYAEQDTRITATAPQMEEQLKKDGHPYQIKIYPGVNHAFHNDTGPRYNAEQAEAVWVATIEWFRKYLP